MGILIITGAFVCILLAIGALFAGANWLWHVEERAQSNRSARYDIKMAQYWANVDRLTGR